MRTLKNLFIVALAAGFLFACKSSKTSKSTYSFGTPYHKFETENPTASTSNVDLEITEKAISIQEIKTQPINQQVSTINKSALNKKELKIVKKIENKIEKIQKIRDEQGSKASSLTKNLKLGILLASIGLLLLILGGLGISILYVFGAIAFIAGGVLILLEVLDM